MIIASLTLLLLTAQSPEVPDPSKYRTPTPAVDMVDLRAAAARAAHRSAGQLGQGSVWKRDEPYRLSPKTGRTVAGVIIGVATGFVGGLMIYPAISHGECQSPLWLVGSTTAVGGAIGGWLFGR